MELLVHLVLPLLGIILALVPAPVRGDDTGECRLPSVGSALGSVGFPLPAKALPSLGRLKVLLIFVDFPDQQANESAEQIYQEYIPRVQSFYRDSSWNQLAVDFLSTRIFHRMPSPSRHYGIWRGSPKKNYQTYVQDALAVYNKTTKADVLFVAPTRVAAGFYGVALQDMVPTTRQGVQIASRAVLLGPGAFTDEDYTAMIHELGHTIGLPDLYPTAPRTKSYVGGFDLMSQLRANSPDFFAWDKWRLQWIRDSRICCIASKGVSVHSLWPMDTPNQMPKAVVIKRDEKSALVLEVRTRYFNETGSCSVGLLPYQVYTDRGSGKGPIAVVDSTPSSPGCANNTLNDAPLTMDRPNLAMPGWGINVTLLSVQEGNYTFRVRRY